jgi:hypothetical protein
MLKKNRGLSGEADGRRIGFLCEVPPTGGTLEHARGF